METLTPFLLEPLLPPWATGRASGSFAQVGAQLCTKDGRRIGNAVVVSVDQRLVDQSVKVVVEIITDIGTRLILTPSELAEFFHTPEWLMDTQRFREILAARKRC